MPGNAARTFLFCLRADLRRAFGGWVFWVVVLLVVVIQLLDMAEEYFSGMSRGGVSAVYLFTAFASDDALLFMCLAILPGALSFCSDWEHHFIRSSLIRSGHAAYTWSKVAATAASAFLAVFLANMITASLLASHLPAFLETDLEYGGNPYSTDAISRLAVGSPWSFYTALSAAGALACMSWAVFALLVSTYLPNRLVVLAVPIIIYYALVYFVPLPPFLTPSSVMYGTVGGPDDNPGLVMLYLFMLNTALVVIWGLLFSQNVRRRLAGA